MPLRVGKFLILLLILVFIIQILSSPLPWGGLSPAVLIAQGGLFSRAVWEYGQWFRLGTAVFLHASISHLFFNIVALWYAAYILEELAKPCWFAALFLLSGLGGSLLSLYAHDPGVVSVGASGGIMGLFAALLFLLKISPRDRSFRKGARADAIKILVLSLLPLFNVLGISVDMWGHLGGALTGCVLGACLTHWGYHQQQPRYQWLATIISLSIGLLVGYGFWQIIRFYPNLPMA